MTALIAYSLASSHGDFATAVAAAAAGGWDTDSAGATVGAVCGALAGAAALPSSWTRPLCNRIASSLPGFDGVAIDELARRTLVSGGALLPEWRDIACNPPLDDAGRGS